MNPYENIHISRRHLIKAGSAVAATAALYPGLGAFAKSDNPIKIGQVTPGTGTYSALGGNQVAGAKLAVDQINSNGGVMGRPVQLLLENTGSDVGKSVQKVRKLVHRNNVDFLTGSVSSAVALADSQASHGLNTLYMDLGGHADAITGKKCSWNTFRTCSTTWLLTAGDFHTLFEQFGKKWFFLTPDYNFGHALHRDYVQQLKQAGGQEVGNALAPLGTTDFSSYLIKAKSANPDVLIILNAGNDQINALKQVHQFGIQNDMGIGGPMMEMETLESLPADARVGYWNMEWYWNQPNTPHVQKFVEDYKKSTKANKVPTARSWFGYAGTHALALAAEKAQSLNTMKVVKALEGLELPPEIALQPHKAVYRSSDHQLIGSQFPGQIRKNGSYPHLFDLSSIVDSSKIARSAEAKGCSMSYPSSMSS